MTPSSDARPVDDSLQSVGSAVPVTELVATFRAGIAALVPAADQAELIWGDLDTSDGWEILAECAFDVFVRAPLAESSGARPDDLPLPRYDYDYDNYANRSWLGFSDDAGDWAFVRFLSVAEPFDTAQFVRVEPESFDEGVQLRLPFGAVTFTLIRRDSAGVRDVVDHVEWEE